MQNAKVNKSSLRKQLSTKKEKKGYSLFWQHHLTRHFSIFSRFIKLLSRFVRLVVILYQTNVYWIYTFWIQNNVQLFSVFVLYEMHVFACATWTNHFKTYYLCLHNGKCERFKNNNTAFIINCVTYMTIADRGK